MTTTFRSPWLIAFAAVSALHLVLLGADVTPWDSITKCLIAPLLVGWVLSVRGPRILALALGFCFLGDLFLEIEPLFVVGMAAFAAGHVCFIRHFVSRGAVAGLRARPWLLPLLVLVAVGLVVACWDGLEPALRAPVPVYALLLVGTAATSLAVDRVAGLGGLSFLVSDGLIALGEAGRIHPDDVAPSLAVMILYVLGILGLAVGIVREQQRSRATDCWPTLPQQV